jgi:hypothetical protein
MVTLDAAAATARQWVRSNGGERFPCVGFPDKAPMLETVNKILALPHVERYRKVFVFFAVALLGLHFLAFGLNLAFPDSARAERLASFSYNLYGVTGGLLLIVVLGAAIRAMTDSRSPGQGKEEKIIYSVRP